MKREARSMLMAATSTKQIILLVDTLERLGLGYHFDSEIEEKLKQVYDSVEEEQDAHNLFVAALRFRLLRQHQYHVSCNVFEKFVGENKEFKETLGGDAEGILSLYEAAHVRTGEENILEGAVEFTRRQLSRMLPELKSPHLREKVKRALKHPLHRSVPIVEIRFYIPIYENDESRDELLLKLAKLNFNYLQNMYRNELVQLLRWWNKFDIKSKLVYTRDRMVECYFWGMIHNFEPKYSYVRKAAAINYQLITIIDDIYDNYATLEEAEQFTRALERWNMDHADNLPDYMKVVYDFNMNVYEDIEREAKKQDKTFILPYYREAVKDICRAYYEEQKWVMQREMPSFEKYMKNSVIRSCLPMTLGSLVPGLQSVTKETIDWMLTQPKIFMSSSIIVRLLDDLGSHERENKEGKLLTIVDCYMKDKGGSKQEALSKFGEIIDSEWKDMNEEWVKSAALPKEILLQFLNFIRGGEVTYSNSEDGHTNPEKYLAPIITALLLDPLLI
ncbi:hypothetical protein C2S53_020433 [Perilla frutescens var. hirtella]|uniref:Uncharacterized protein n=1 Tax=Perilla frutescens var. hirtella TaxID=608512 RepID=A0AAD4NZ81_PERFH|nr:hypothetical protein C2S53_020433 [Perilla frutescens var. hirtella]